MYQMDGKQYLLVPAASAPPGGRGAGAGPAAAPTPVTAAQGSTSSPLGWVVYTLLAK